MCKIEKGKAELTISLILALSEVSSLRASGPVKYLLCFLFLSDEEDEDVLPSYIEAVVIREELFLDLRKQ